MISFYYFRTNYIVGNLFLALFIGFVAFKEQTIIKRILKMTIKVINKSKHALPKYQTELSAGMDLYANISEPITLKSLEKD